ncbi:uncharacterized protein LOC118195774 [Stegodyphus dumicola]|uniref:uncharacterized protein LOC118190135 n=1 Tax=Stegodyphus dumicola TaxID=202533 RepID=UPI0015B25B4A|nr:uncharacterized protein LOC118190135 [Stegodyphus dumicola]XP_035222989.1 uncharacterized protein LOC118195774 [Stegodyphus dumicola]
MHLRMCAALAFLKLEDVDDGWLLIQEYSPEDPKLQEFYDYFVNQWMDNALVTIEMWNCNNRRHRTNNAVEGWNNKLNHALMKHHPTVRTLVATLKKEAEYSDFLICRKELKLVGKRRRKNYIRIDERIEKCFIEYELTKDLRKFLRTVAVLQKFE